MDKLVNVLLAIDNANTVSQRALDCRPGLIGFKPGLWDLPFNSLSSEYLYSGDTHTGGIHKEQILTNDSTENGT